MTVARATFTDDSGDVRLSGTLTLDDGTFTVDGALTVSPSDPLLDDLLLVEAPAGFADDSNTGNMLRVTDGTTDVLLVDAYGEVFVKAPAGQPLPQLDISTVDYPLARVTLSPHNLTCADDAGRQWLSASPSQTRFNTDAMGFFTHAAVAQPSVTGSLSTVVDPAAKAVLTSLLAALVSLGLATNGTT